MLLAAASSDKLDDRAWLSRRVVAASDLTRAEPSARSLRLSSLVSSSPASRDMEGFVLPVWSAGVDPGAGMGRVAAVVIRTFTSSWIRFTSV